MRDGGGEQEGGWSVFGNDDGYLFGPPDIVFPALERFAGRILARRSMRLQRAKTEVFCWGELPAGTPADLKRAGMEVNGVNGGGVGQGQGGRQRQGPAHQAEGEAEGQVV